MDKEQLLAIIKTQLKAKGMSASEASELAVGNPYLITNIGRSRYGMPSTENLVALCNVLDLEFYVGPPRAHVDIPQVDPEAELGFTLISRYAAEASAGRGSTVTDASVEERVAFPTSWLTQHRISPSDAVMLRARGNSMQPVIWHGDTLLLDLSQRVPPVRRKGGVSLRKGYQEDIFVLERDGDLLVKAVRRPAEDTLILMSENRSSYEPEVISGIETNSIRIIGKVVWWGHVAT
ncbi:S24 family peptidase [Salipiger marinus]|uniref:S24 family peptidase n=1 Tax=Salipiger marinus TaxID=555512 RepID=UPI0040581B1E